MPGSPQREGEPLGYIESLRGIAILGVLLVHSAVATRQTGLVFELGFTGQRGVQLFYVVSAFTLCYSLDRRKQEHRPLRNFYIRRFFRIAPLFYLVILINFLLRFIAPDLSPQSGLSIGEILLGVFFLNGLSPHAINLVVAGGWSIAVETSFYLVLPLLHRHINKIERAVVSSIFAACALTGLSWYLIIHCAGDSELLTEYFSFLWFPIEFPIFLIGIIAFCVWSRYIDRKLDGSMLKRRLSITLLVASCLVYWCCLPFNNIKLYPSSLLFLPLLLALSLYPWSFLVNRFTRFVGKISYSLYLVHLVVLVIVSAAMKSLDAHPSHLVTQYVLHRRTALPLFYFGFFSVSVLISMLTWKYIEQPGIRLGRALVAWNESRAKSALYVQSAKVRTEP